ncbi:succinate dehydrogenase hydrophobic membrane anchor subunit [Micrococcus sp. EYE_162]|uniref:succinate dehydrogenase hydrophobic membrane anchor subunit n=1 Tax=unclassified Micrococcus TaxID=2620948 RepID=UPI002003B31A|nr:MULTISPECIES: succinate dehydrogenase hydrophobic membrane anchor subunit [unclassified Micrococcus]MCK6094689.1 succinate dehydrogenase hydrophobic membrane anchor subunit [Micrococcus sp. EYE_212]MCK6171259.1 succinate dehydrogenase hydrophobic membrane anchor subunit [Micrococcus sp. EYE_162]
MSTTAETPLAAPRSGKLDPKYTRSKGGEGNFEMLAWLFMRVSGVILVVLLFTHLFTNLMVGDGISGIDFGFVAGKWAHPLWQFWDLALLWLAMLHGANGMRTIINDYAERDRVRFWLSMILYIATAAIIILGTLVIFTFDACMVDASGALMERSPAICR